MSDELNQLKAVMESMRGELDAMKSRLNQIERVVCIDKDDDGVETVHIECTDLLVRPWTDPCYFAVHIGSTEDGGYIDIHYKGEEHAIKPAISLGMQADGEPHIQVRGKDFTARADICIQKDHGVVAVMGTKEERGAVMRAQPGGGSVAVLHPDGRPRAVLIHNERHQSPDSDAVAPSTDLIFANGSLDTLIKLHSDGRGSLITAGMPGHADGVAITVRENGPAIMLRGLEDSSSINMMAADNMARVSVHEGRLSADKAQASLAAGSFGSSMELRENDGTRRVDISAMSEAGTVQLLDATGSEAVALSHHSGSHSSLAMRGVAEHDCVRILTNKDAALVRVTSPENADTDATIMVHEGRPSLIVRRDNRPLVTATETEHGGLICAYGREEVQGGVASLSGGPMGGVVSVCARDGTQLMTLDGTDHGGRLLINNDLGFQRVVLGARDEAGVLVLNNTGSNGVIATAMPKGGVISVCDAEGNVIRTMPEVRDDD
ncbi:MAG: hypothetical protein JNG86_07940 [Verrucomicrobiaceae bacterium]|nr:hypothetical protein [Verrucomicrobiaceae bacterium]